MALRFMRFVFLIEFLQKRGIESETFHGSQRLILSEDKGALSLLLDWVIEDRKKGEKDCNGEEGQEERVPREERGKGGEREKGRNGWYLYRMNC